MKIKNIRLILKVCVVSLLFLSLIPIIRTPKTAQTLKFVTFMTYMSKALSEGYRMKEPREVLSAIQDGLRELDPYLKICYTDECIKKAFRLSSSSHISVYGVYLDNNGTIESILPHSVAAKSLKVGLKIEKISSSKETETDPKKFLEFLINHPEVKIFLKNKKTISLKAEKLEPIYLDFQENTAKLTFYSFKKEETDKLYDFVKRIKASNIDKIIFDMRYCPGGRVADLVAALSMFLPADTPLFAEEMKGKNILYTSKGRFFNRFDLTKFKGEIIGLKSHHTASSAEIFLGVLKYHLKDRIKLIGPRTYGKWSTIMAKLFPQGGIILTVGEIHLPDGTTYEGKGI